MVPNNKNLKIKENYISTKLSGIDLGMNEILFGLS